MTLRLEACGGGKTRLCFTCAFTRREVGTKPQWRSCEGAENKRSDSRCCPQEDADLCAVNRRRKGSTDREAVDMNRKVFVQCVVHPPGASLRSRTALLASPLA